MSEDWNKNLDSFFGHLSKWDKDTFIFGAIVALTMTSLVFGAPPVATIFAGCIFTVLYIILRYALLSVQAREHEDKLKHLPRSRARRILVENASQAELKTLDELTEKVKQKPRKN